MPSETGAKIIGAVQVRLFAQPDWEAVQEIYAQGLAGRMATFETSVPDWPEWDARHLTDCRLVAARGNEVVGFAALTPVSQRPCYRGVAEVSVYVRDVAHGVGVGSALLARLVSDSEAAGFWTLQASMFPENEVSVRLHASCGFRLAARRERIARLDGSWRDTILMERRRADERHDPDSTSNASE